MLKAILTIGGIQAVAIAIQFIRSKLTAVMLGPAGVGVVATIDQFVQFAAFASALSLPLASVKFMSRAHSENRESFRRAYAGFFQLLAALAAAGTLVASALVYLRPQIFGVEVEKYQLLILVALAGVPALVLGGFFTNVFAAAGDYRRSAALAVVTNTATTAAVVAGIFAAGVFGLFVGGAAASLLLTFGVVVYLWRKLDLSVLSDGRAALRELWHSPRIVSFTLMLYLGSISYSLSMLVARYAMLVNHGEAETGLLQGALVLSVAIGTVLNPANGLYLTPIMNRNLEKTEKIRQALDFQRKMLLILSLITLLVAMFPQSFLALLFSTKFAAVGNLVFLFVFAQLVTQLAGVHQAMLVGFDDLKFYTVAVAGGQLGYAALAWLLAPSYGIKGVAGAAIASSAAIYLLTFLRLKFRHGFALPRNLGLMTFYVLVVLFLTGWTCSRFDEWDVATALAKLVFFVLFALSLLFFLRTDERTVLYGLGDKILFGR